MANADTWSDFESLRHSIKQNTVDRLKQILAGLNEECGTHLFKSGKKQEIIDRIVDALDTWRRGNSEDKWLKAKAVLHQVRNSGLYTPSRMSAVPAVHATAPASQSYMAAAHKAVTFHPTDGVPRYDPYAPPRKPIGPAPSTSSVSKPPEIRFKPSPFYHIEQAVSNVIECPESVSATDRRQQTVTFTLDADQIAKLKAPGTRFQLRLFCTSSNFYSPASLQFRTVNGPCPIEFPPTCEVRINNLPLTANLKGLKKKPGTAPPADLGKAVRLSNLQNRVEMIYVNSQQPAQPKKFYLVVMLVETTTVEQLVEKLRKGKYRSTSDIRQRMVASMTDDDDIVAGPQKMSLKCPLSFTRVVTPCRSAQCVHPQCFDAASWFSVMEQTTTWLCPVCEKVLNHEDLIIDGYFDEILKQSPDSVEDVMVEADGEWHTSDDKYSSANWKLAHPSSTASTSKTLSPRKSTSAHTSPSQTPIKPTLATTDADGNPKRSNVEIVVLDSDDEDEGRVKRELSPSFGTGSSASANRSRYGASMLESQSDGVIDLTLDSDEDEIPLSKRAGKRKASDALSPTEQIWKKGRTTSQSRAAGESQSSSSTHVNGSARYSSQDRNSTASSPPTRYAAPPYPGAFILPYPARGSSSNAPQLLPGKPYGGRLDGSVDWP